MDRSTCGAMHYFTQIRSKKQLHLLKQWDIDTSKNWLDLKQKNSCFSFWLFYVPCSSLAPFANFMKVCTKEAGIWFRF